MNDYKLKPCPFCGAEPEAGTTLYEYRGSEVSISAKIQCPKCKIFKRRIFKVADDYMMIPFSDYIIAFDGVINDWNQRATEEADI